MCYPARCALLFFVLFARPLSAQQPRAVYISGDMEGVAGLSDTEDPLGRRLMTLEVNAAIAGAFAGGATRVVVNDAHGSHDNLLQDLLDQRATLIRGDLKPFGMMEGLDSSFAAVVFIGYHARAGVPEAFAAHTGSGRVADLRINGRSVGEGGMNVLYAAWYGVPVVFASGDSLAVEELRSLLPGLAGVAVKQGIWGRAVRSLSPDSSQAAIRRGVAAAVSTLGGAPALPGGSRTYRVELEYSAALYADIAAGIPGVRRVGPRTVQFESDRYPSAYRLIRLLYKHLSP